MLENANTLIELLEPISKFFHIITHPVIIWNGFLSISYWLAVIVGAVCIILYVCGHRGAIKWTTSSIVLYTILRAISGVV